MPTATQQRANTENAQHSTGPRTAEGKHRSSQNAMKHGLCALDPFIPGEDPAAFQEHFCEIELDLRPATAIESNLVEQIADVSWRLKRLSRIDCGVLHSFRRMTEAGTGFSSFPGIMVTPGSRCTESALRHSAPLRLTRARNLLQSGEQLLPDDRIDRLL